MPSTWASRQNTSLPAMASRARCRMHWRSRATSARARDRSRPFPRADRPSDDQGRQGKTRFATDEHFRAGAALEDFSQLKPVFARRTAR